MEYNIIVKNKFISSSLLVRSLGHRNVKVWDKVNSNPIMEGSKWLTEVLVDIYLI